MLSCELPLSYVGEHPCGRACSRCQDEMDARRYYGPTCCVFCLAVLVCTLRTYSHFLKLATAVAKSLSSQRTKSLEEARVGCSSQGGMGMRYLMEYLRIRDGTLSARNEINLWRPFLSLSVHSSFHPDCTKCRLAHLSLGASILYLNHWTRILKGTLVLTVHMIRRLNGRLFGISWMKKVLRRPLNEWTRTETS
jgi:hypothetical protein